MDKYWEQIFVTDISLLNTTADTTDEVNVTKRVYTMITNHCCGVF